ncbi:uncharacterized protein LOC124721742 [Schistocerca piceifrons]|uniref:uncharacterized protein LOC124721742 n=1 Tax=Schistocerca piceifrons TaxID=274613 RepID=UPI001F5E76D9|nr:uncharacterized protein LOC124721742 [Schistocerca piceifrons]XP_049781835.1 uncharacterized protein LOC126183696 [Schistocerca cancellata]XP_049805426.1 uncharacterized protein LOC126248464 [Schistocerca nitens]XP_049846589.1 uncharacterized protein LOC126299001 [Schistocerca gregaria]XP_049954109.1 uncharacterized protein LOC126470356 isoform X2 [Schistocerca serialis cubense]
MAAAAAVQDPELAFRFYDRWRRRNEALARRWLNEPLCQEGQPPAIFHSLHCKIQLLRQEIASLVAKDTEIFEQLFALQEAVLDLKDQVDYSSSSESASPYQSPSSTRSNSSSEADRNVRTKRSASFVRQHVSYPPIKRNRSNRMKATTPQHGCQDSYDSGIHTSDHEIFV